MKNLVFNISKRVFRKYYRLYTTFDQISALRDALLCFTVTLVDFMEITFIAVLCIRKFYHVPSMHIVYSTTTHITRKTSNSSKCHYVPFVNITNSTLDSTKFQPRDVPYDFLSRSEIPTYLCRREA